MIRLEQTIIERARGYLASVRAFYAKADQADAHDLDDFQNNHAGLTALLEFGHMADSGMSAEGVEALQKIEDEHAEAHRASVMFEAFPPLVHTVTQDKADLQRLYPIEEYHKIGQGDAFSLQFLADQQVLQKKRD